MNLHAALALALAACNAPREPLSPPEQVELRPEPSAAESAPPPVPSASPVPPPLTSISVVLRAGDAPCVLAFDALAEDDGDSWELHGITRLATLPSEGCAAGVLFDGTADGGALPRAKWLKPGHAFTGEDAIFADELPPGLEDLDFDGYLDLCAMIDPTSETPQRCWIFDPAARVFVAHPELDVIGDLHTDKDKRVLTSFWRSGSIYSGGEYSFIGGRFEQTSRVTYWLGERPDGTPIPGYVWVVLEERRGGKLVEIYARQEKER